MSAQNLSRIRHLEGQLCINPSDLSTAFPHGGTAIGSYREARFSPNEKFEGITAEEYGGAVVERVYVGSAPMMRCILRDWDPDALSKVWPNSASAATSGERVITLNGFQTGKNRGGYLMTALDVALCFSPKDLERSPMIILYRCIPRVDDAAELALALPEEFGLPVVFEAIPDGTGRLGQIGLREDLST